jgi:hypothetical protein
LIQLLGGHNAWHPIAHRPWWTTPTHNPPTNPRPFVQTHTTNQTTRTPIENKGRTSTIRPCTPGCWWIRQAWQRQW